MLAVVKAPHIELRGDIPADFLQGVFDYFGKDAVSVFPEDSDQLFAAESSPIYKSTRAKMSPGVYMRVCREIRGMTQAALGEKLGDVSRQNVSAMEAGRRAISKKMIKKLARIFNVSPERFL
jgi:antitoxin component HigA of HigAB toxin-antitoxin module